MWRAPVAGLALACALVASGCGFGPGPSSGSAPRLDVTRDFGHQLLDSAKVAHVHSSDTVMRFLEAAHRVTTRYGGGFVQSIDGLAGDRSAQRDWFFYVNGIEAGVGAADFTLSAGDRVQWDLHSWRATMRIPGIVGAYPEPFVHGYRGRRLPVRVECERPDAQACKDVTDRLQSSGMVVTSAALGAPGDHNVARGGVAKGPALRR